MQSDLDTLARIQSLDLRAAELSKEIAELPKHIALIEKQLDAHQRRLDADKALLAGNQKDRRLCESEVQAQQQKISKLREQMMSAKTNEQYRAFEHEIAFCEAAIKTQEDRVIELMEHVESLEKNVKAAEADLAAERVEVDKQKAEARTRTAADEALLAENRAERKTALASVAPNIAAAYEKAAKRFRGFAVSDASQGRCSACHLELRPQYFQELRRRDKLMICENCSRILHYNPPVAFDESGPGSSAAPTSPARSGTRVDMS
ncbi:MAG: C4-type zinc ribbon domain-containing protein [Bryobacteraceae bacterium]